MRLRKPSPTADPEVRRDLEALDAFLGGRSEGAIDAELAELVRALESERPVPREEFARALDGRVETAFRKPERRTPFQALEQRTWRPTALALGTAASVFIVAVALVSGGGSGGDDSGPVETRSPSAASKESAPAGGGAAASTPAPPQRDVLLSPARRRKVERSASLTLAPPRDEVEEVADAVVRTTDRYGGFVFNSNVSSGEEGARATLDLRLPSTRLRAALADLSKLAHVRARTEGSQDVTARFVLPRRNLADALAERRALLRQLARAVTPNETAAIKARLRIVGTEIERARDTLRRLENRVRFAALSVSVEPGTAKGDGGWSAGDAAHDALTVLGAIAGGSLVALAVLLPAAILLAAVLAARAAYLRRARETSLGAVEKPPAR